MTIKKLLLIILTTSFCLLNTQKANALSFAEFIYNNAKINNLNSIKHYLNKGYNIDAPDSNGYTALCHALELKDFTTYKRINL